MALYDRFSDLPRIHLLVAEIRTNLDHFEENNQDEVKQMTSLLEHLQESVDFFEACLKMEASEQEAMRAELERLIAAKAICLKQISEDEKIIVASRQASILLRPPSSLRLSFPLAASSSEEEQLQRKKGLVKQTIACATMSGQAS